MGELLKETLHAGNFLAAEQHLKQALELCRKLSALKKQGELGADTGFQVDNSIITLFSLGNLSEIGTSLEKLPGKMANFSIP